MSQVSHYKSLSSIVSRPRGGLRGKVVCIYGGRKGGPSSLFVASCERVWCGVSRRACPATQPQLCELHLKQARSKRELKLVALSMPCLFACMLSLLIKPPTHSHPHRPLHDSSSWRCPLHFAKILSPTSYAYARVGRALHVFTQALFSPNT